MAVFDESKVINALHADEAEVGKKYWRSSSLLDLKDMVEREYCSCIDTLVEINKDNRIALFEFGFKLNFEFIYPYEEPKPKLMTNRQLCEWLAKGNGEFCVDESEGVRFYTSHSYYARKDDDYVDCDCRIRCWNSNKWIKPTEDVYLRDCKGDC